MEAKELKIQVPEGYEIDKENSTFECIKFKLIKKGITYKNVSNKLFNDNEKIYYYIDSCGDIQFCQTTNVEDANNATNVKQLKRILALNQLLNIAEYYNRLHTKIDKCYNILYDMRFKGYRVSRASAAMLKLNIIRKALNLGQGLHFAKNPENSYIYHPYNPLITEAKYGDMVDFEII